MPVATTDQRVLPPEDWAARTAAHQRRVDPLIQPHLERRHRGERHPVHDFLFTYYSFRPAQLRRWHPGYGAVLAGRPPHESWRGYTRDEQGVTVDGAHLAKRIETVRWVKGLLAATASRPAMTGCLGLHEWAMVYRAEQVRHNDWPLRLGRSGTDAVVEANRLRCTHADAYRFFARDAAPRNAVRPTRDRQVELEQRGCLHANMDLYKWAYKLSPLVPSDLVVDAFELAAEIRELDMRASPYDLTALGYEPVRIETPEGRREYVEVQRSFAERSVPVRTRLIKECDRLLAINSPVSP